MVFAMPIRRNHACQQGKDKRLPFLLHVIGSKLTIFRYADIMVLGDGIYRDDLCKGKSSMEKCTAKTVRQLAKALGCSMEELMDLGICRKESSEAEDKVEKEMRDCMEYGLPDWLYRSIKTYADGINSSIADCLYCELQSDINVAEVEQLITSSQAWYLREKYLGIKKEGEAE